MTMAAMASHRVHTGEDSTSPFLQNLLRFSPNNSSGYRLSPTRTVPRFLDHDTGVPIATLRHLARQALQQWPVSSAVFYASLAYAKTAGEEDALLLAEAHWRADNPSACLRVLEQSSLLTGDQPWNAVLLACAAMAGQEEWQAMAELMEDVCRWPAASTTSDLPPRPSLEDHDTVGWQQLAATIAVVGDDGVHPLARLLYWRGRAYYELGHGARAAVYWQKALGVDVRCQAALDALLARHLLPAREVYMMLQGLDFTNLEWLQALYLASIELTPGDVDSSVEPEPAKSFFPADTSSIHLASPLPTFTTPSGAEMALSTTKKQQPVSTSHMTAAIDDAFDKLWHVYRLEHAPPVLASAARRAYRRYEWKTALAYCEELDQIDPALPDAAYCYVSTLILLGHKQSLFRIAHEWVEAAPKAAHSWFAVGAYYYCCERYHVAQRHFCRATRLDPQCTEAWIAFGCSFAAVDESDQALASFRAAQRLSPGEHTSLLYMGMEYVRTNHLVLAQYFLQASRKASGGDPLCLHELGVLSLQKNELEMAIQWFQRALKALIGVSLVEECIELLQDPFWEPTLFNLGHAYRKAGELEEAARCFGRCIALCPQKFSTYAALAFTKHMMRDLDRAIELYHQALSCKPDDPFSTEMLNRALREAMEQGLNLHDLEEEARMTSRPARQSLLSATASPFSFKDDSMMSEDMESDVDMSAG